MRPAHVGMRFAVDQGLPLPIGPGAMLSAGGPASAGRSRAPRLRSARQTAVCRRSGGVPETRPGLRRVSCETRSLEPGIFISDLTLVFVEAFRRSSQNRQIDVDQHLAVHAHGGCCMTGAHDELVDTL